MLRHRAVRRVDRDEIIVVEKDTPTLLQQIPQQGFLYSLSL